MSQMFNSYENKPFWKKDIFIVIMLLFCTPVGLILMWTVGEWDSKTKLIVTLVIVGLIILSGATQLM